ncbi:hypothetical protein [Corynebacterium auriscanis]|uniref:hypothetical protein n=1 Tax=Corynebacterium auriscanis TaxID=99807 RepID=UPI003CE9841D
MNRTLLKRITVSCIAVTSSLAMTGYASAVPAKDDTAEKTAVSEVSNAEYGSIKITGTSLGSKKNKGGRSVASEDDKGYSIQSNEKGESFSQVITIDSDESPDSYAFNFDLPEGFTLSEAPDGGAFFRMENGEAAGRIKAPWAVDANGKKVDTHFEVHDNHLVQKVDLSQNIAYPVTADPDGAWGWTKCIAAVTAAVAYPVGGAIKLAKFVKSIGSVKESMQLLLGATSNKEKLAGGLKAAGATAAELLGIAAVKDNC